MNIYSGFMNKCYGLIFPIWRFYLSNTYNLRKACETKKKKLLSLWKIIVVFFLSLSLSFAMKYVIVKCRPIFNIRTVAPIIIIMILPINIIFAHSLCVCVVSHWNLMFLVCDFLCEGLEVYAEWFRNDSEILGPFKKKKKRVCFSLSCSHFNSTSQSTPNATKCETEWKKGSTQLSLNARLSRVYHFVMFHKIFLCFTACDEIVKCQRISNIFQ